MRIHQWNTQNSNNVIDKTIQNSNKEFFKNKNTNKNLADTKTLDTTGNFTSTCFEHAKNEKNTSANRKIISEANEKKKQKKIGATTTRPEVMRIK